MKKTLYFFVTFLLWGLGAGSASALTVSPLKYEVSVVPGEEQVLTVTVQNNEDAAKTVSITAVPLSQSPSGGALLGTAGSGNASWAVPSEGTVVLPQAGKKKISVSIKPPPGTEPGSAALAVVIAEEPTTQKTVGLSARVAVPILVTVAGTVTEAMKIVQWEPSWKVVNGNGEVKLIVQNVGTVREMMAGKMQIEKDGMVVESKEITLGNELFPGTRREITVPINFEDVHILPKQYHLKVIIQFGKNHLVVGSTTAVWGISNATIVLVVGAAAVLIWVLVYFVFIRKRKFVLPV